MNERHYGALVGLSKAEAEISLGKEDVMDWRRSWDKVPPPMHREDKKALASMIWSKPITIVTQPGMKNFVSLEKEVDIPDTESLKDCANRVLPIWSNGILPRLIKGETVLVVAHANSIRSLVMHIDQRTITVESIRDVHIPQATPLVYTFNVSNKIYRDEDEKVENIEEVKVVGEPSLLGMRGKFLVSEEIVSLALNQKENLQSLEDENLNCKTNTYNRCNSFYKLIDKAFNDIKDYVEGNDIGKEEPILITDAQGIIVHTNEKWKALCGFDLDEVKGKTCSILQGKDTSKDQIMKINEELRTGLFTKATK